MVVTLVPLILVNLAISIWNSYATGKAWVEAKYAGGWPRFMTWMGAVMAASGMTWCILTPLILLAVNAGKLTPDWGQVGMDLGFVLLTPGILFSGLMITINSWARAYRTRKILDLGLAGYNSFAQVYNTYHAIRGFGPAFRRVTKAFLGGKGRKSGATMVILLAIVALGAGIIITAAIIQHVAASTPLPTYDEARKQLQPA
ncbi:MAG: hypothetical protein ABSF29_16675 [Tepidisphaeraceae bacterium]|jgi:hypothetical protein